MRGDGRGDDVGTEREKSSQRPDLFRKVATFAVAVNKRNKME